MGKSHQSFLIKCRGNVAVSINFGSSPQVALPFTCHMVQERRGVERSMVLDHGQTMGKPWENHGFSIWKPEKWWVQWVYGGKTWWFLFVFCFCVKHSMGNDGQGWSKWWELVWKMAHWLINSNHILTSPTNGHRNSWLPIKNHHL